MWAATTTWEPVHVALPLVAGKSSHVPFTVDRRAEYDVAVEARRRPSDAIDLACVLGIADRADRCERLAFRWLLRSHGVRIGEDRYSGFNYYLSREPFVSATFAIFDLDPGSYVLDITEIHAPPSLARNAPNVEADLDPDIFGGLPLFLLLGFTSALAAIAGVLLLGASLVR